MSDKAGDGDSSRKKALTIVGKKMAFVGSRFIYNGPLTECKSCRVKNICFSLTPGRTYVVIAVREREHPCNIFEDGAKVVEVELAPVRIAVDGNKAIEGSVVSPRETSCPIIACPFNNRCTLKELKKGDKLKILSVGKKIDCPEKRVEVEAIPVG